MSTQTSGCLGFCRRTRQTALEAPPAPPGIRSLFENYSEKGNMSVANLQRFLVEVQKEKNVTVEYAQTIVKKTTGSQRRGLHLEAFFNYLFGETNPPIDPNLGVHHDMTAPLSHYFIYSGLNFVPRGTGLDAAIIQGLRRGVRVIDLNLWPNSTNDDVIAKDSGGWTAPDLLIKCLKSIKEHAFSASEYPVVVTLEDHLTANLQALVAQMISETFEELLFTPDQERLKEFPSPESLKKKIILSTKPTQELEVKKKEKVFRLKLTWGLEVRYSKSGIYADEDEEDSEDDATTQYRNLIAIHGGKRKGGRLDDWLKNDPNKVRYLSLSEYELEEASETHATKDIVRFTQRNLLRVSIPPIRYPFIGWMHGAQMVYPDLFPFWDALLLRHGMFRANGGCGYVKKPDILLNHSEIFDPNAQLQVKTTLKVTVCMGYGLHVDSRDPPGEFFVQVGISGVPRDTIALTQTKAVSDTWIPAWDEEFEFPLRAPELALLWVEVREGNQTSLPVFELKEGIRAVPLHDYEGNQYNSKKLLMQFKFV